jgi:hypothetical protein
MSAYFNPLRILEPVEPKIMQIHWQTLGLLLLLTPVSFGGPPNAANRDDDTARPIIAKVLPAEYEVYRKALTGDGGVNDANASLLLLSKARDASSKSPSGSGQRKEKLNAYHAAWRLCLKLAQKSKDQAARRLVLDEWNKSLSEDGENIPSQLYALSRQYEQTFLTDDFWKLFEQTKNRETMSATCYVLYRHGTREDAERLEKRCDSLPKGDPFAGIMVNAINWMRYRLSGDRTNPGPAHRPPTIE